MDCNKDEAIRAKDLAEKKMQSRDFLAARRMALRAQRLFPDIENIPQMLAVCEVHCSAGVQVKGEMNWYRILQVEPTAEESSIKNQGGELAILLNPDKNKFPGAEEAFKLIVKAYYILSDRARRNTYDMKINEDIKTTAHVEQSKQVGEAIFAGSSCREAETETFNDLKLKKGLSPVDPSRQASWNICPKCHKKYQSFHNVFYKSLSCQNCEAYSVAYDLDAKHLPQSGSPGNIRNNFGPINDDHKVGPINVIIDGEVDTNCETSKDAKLVKNNLSKVKQGRKSAKSTNSNARQKRVSSLVSGSKKSEGLAIKVSDTPTKTFAPKTPTRRSTRLCKKISSNKVGSENENSTTTVITPTSTPQRSTRRNKNISSNAVESQDGNNRFVESPCTKKRRTDSSINSDRHTKELSHETANKGEVCDSMNDVASKWSKHSQLQERSQHGNLQIEGCERGTGMEEKKSGTTTQFNSDNSADMRTLCYPDPEFCEFDKSRSANRFAANQIWATYDDKDGMPRFYAQIKKVHAPEFKVHFTWLEHNPENESEIAWSDEELPVACGNYLLGTSDVTNDQQMFSHLVTSHKGKKKNSFDIYPKVGEIWALFKDWSIGWCSDADNHKNYKYEVVEVISEFSVNTGIEIIPLVKIKGFVSLFVRAKGKKGAPVVIPASEILRFSHCVPAYRLSGTERKGIPANSVELDCASLPVNTKKAFPSTSSGCRTGNVDKLDRHSSSRLKAMTTDNESADNIRVQHKKRKRQITDFGADLNVENVSPPSPAMFDYPDPEFHNFDKFRSIENFYRGQIWALYSDIDKYPKYYGWIKKVELENRRLHVAWLEACPLEEEEMRWIAEEMPISCGTFKCSQQIMVFGRSEFFSHLVHTKGASRKGQCVILPNCGEVWAIYKNWKVGWRSSDLENCEYDAVEICEATESTIKMLLLTRVSGYKTVFKPERTENAVATFEIPADEFIRFSHQIPAYRLTDEDGGNLHGYWELDTAAVPDHLLS